MIVQFSYVRFRLLLFLASFCVTVSAAAQSVQIEVPGASRLGVFIRNEPLNELTTDIQFSNGATASFAISEPVSEGSAARDMTLYVWDLGTGNLAAKRAKAVGKKWIVTAKEFNRIALVSVRVEHDGEPIAAARVVLKDKSREQSQILDSSSKGEVEFYAVHPGSVSVKVEYRSKGAASEPVVQQFDLKLQRNNPNPLLTVALPNEVETLTPPKALPATKQQAEPTRSKFGQAIVYILMLAFAGGAIFGLYHLAKKHPEWLKGKMKQLGVDVPEDSQPTSDDSSPVPELLPAKPQAQNKILLQDGQLPVAPVAGVGAVVDLSAQRPRLSKSNGETVSLSEGETIVGRDPGLGLSLVNETSVSRRHASITRSGVQLVVKDLGSTNGTYVNGRKIQSETALSSGDDVQFGAVKFRVENR